MAFLGRAISVFAAAALLAGVARPQSSDSELEDNFHWRPALLQSAFFLGIQHGFRFATEPGSREELKGPFLKDWGSSLKGIRGWGDGDTALVNYVGHPMMGAVTGYIYIQNDPRSRVVPFGTDEYWRSRLRAMAFATVYSTQWEIGPVSEANLGNVGKAAGTSGAVDFVVTPLAGFGMIALEDAVDQHIVRRLESKWSNRPWRIMVRSLLNPDRAMANLLRFKTPWHRDDRPGVSHPHRAAD